jgi:hypothetical protein
MTMQKPEKPQRNAAIAIGLESKLFTEVLHINSLAISRYALIMAYLRPQNCRYDFTKSKNAV